jgi:hypothetical protein
MSDDPEAVHLRATILLSFGYLTWYCPVDIVTQRYESIVIKFISPFFDAAKVGVWDTSL